MKFGKHVIVFFALLSLLCIGTPVRAERAPDFPRLAKELQSPPPQRPEDAKSTTGPTPPPEAAHAALSAPRAGAAEVVLTDVPAYLWQDGCGPTSAGMIIGYWDGKGFDSLVSGGAATQTSAVDDMISSAGHYNDYALPKDSYPANPSPLPDRSELPFGDEHPDNSIADFMDTSQSHRGLYYGWSYYVDIPTALTSWVQMVAPQYTATATNRTMPEIYGGTFTWEVFKAEIDAGRPVVLLVDSDSDGYTDHFVAAMGYSDDGMNRMYAARNTWNTTVNWYAFAPMAVGRSFGIYGATLFQIQAATPGAFDKTGPSNGASALGTTATLSWASSSEATSYEYCYYDMTNGNCNGGWPSTTNTSVFLAGLSTGAMYNWQVRARNAAGATGANGGMWWHWFTGPVISTWLPLMSKY